MKIIFLNVWHGRQAQEINSFLLDHTDSTDIFCFQEAYNGFNDHFQKTFQNFKPWVATKNTNPHDNFSQAIYSKNNIKVLNYGKILSDDPASGLGIYVLVERNNEKLAICNFHGISLPGDKLDSDARIRQSETLINFFAQSNTPVVIGGDFNLIPDTKSIRLFEEFSYRNLVFEYNIPTTRNELAWEKHPTNKQLFADYVFVNSLVKIHSFEVLQNTVSDHLPLVLCTE